MGYYIYLGTYTVYSLVYLKFKSNDKNKKHCKKIKNQGGFFVRFSGT